MGDLSSWRESFAADSLGDRTQSVSLVMTAVLLIANRELRPLDQISAGCGPVVEGPSWLSTIRYRGRYVAKCVGKSHLIQRGGGGM